MPPKSGQWKDKATHDDLILFNYEDRSILGLRPQSHKIAQDACVALSIRGPNNCDITFHTNELPICKGQYVEISPEAWEAAIPHVTSLKVIFKAKTDDPFPVAKRNILTFWLHESFESSPRRIKVVGSMRVHSTIEKVLGERYHQYSYYYDVSGIGRDATFDSLGIEDGDDINCIVQQIGGKPVIYLLSPNHLDATVKLSLIPQWSLSAIYPVVPFKSRTPSSGEEVTWRVHVHPNGDLVELTTGLDVAYLFWEAHTNAGIPISPPSSPLQGHMSLDQVQEDFNPITAALTDDNSVVLSTSSITPYLDRALKALGFHTEARTSFITYWLPSLLKHTHIALRFVSQAAYERAAPLEIIPEPENITRVFMLFQGVQEEELAAWKRAQGKSRDDVALWSGIVGVDSKKALDPKIFRVLEWGGMEVQRAAASTFAFRALGNP